MSRAFGICSVLWFSMLLVACSGASKPQETLGAGRYVVKEETPFTNQVYIELKTSYPGGGDYHMNPPSQGKYEIKDGKILLYEEETFHKERTKLKYTGTLKDGDIYIPLSWGSQDLGSLRFRKTDSSQASTEAPTPTPIPTPAPAPALAPPSLDDQAVNEIRKEFETIYAKCGDSYYSKLFAGRYFSYTQHKDVSFTPAPRALDEADKLNGVEWAGTVNVARRFLRESFEQGGQKRWGEYRSVAQGTPQHFNARKLKGRWELDDVFPSLRRGPTSKPTCAEIPKD